MLHSCRAEEKVNQRRELGEQWDRGWSCHIGQTVSQWFSNLTCIRVTCEFVKTETSGPQAEFLIQ